MHSTIGQIGMQVNRKGRKRKSGRRTASGALAKAHVDYQTMAAENPDRRWLPATLRLSEKAGTVLGGLNLIGRITDHQYEAGRRYGIVVGAYRSVIGTPTGMHGSSRGYDCAGLACLVDDRLCECASRKTRYVRAFEAIKGQRVHLAVNRVAVHDEQITEDQMDYLRLGLSALAVHFGLTQQRRAG